MDLLLKSANLTALLTTWHGALSQMNPTLNRFPFSQPPHKNLQDSSQRYLIDQDPRTTHLAGCDYPAEISYIVDISLPEISCVFQMFTFVTSCCSPHISTSQQKSSTECLIWCQSGCVRILPFDRLRGHCHSTVSCAVLARHNTQNPRTDSGVTLLDEAFDRDDTSVLVV